MALPNDPCKDPNAETGHDDDLSEQTLELSKETIIDAARFWDQPHFRDLANYEALQAVGQRIELEARDTTLAPELVRMTLNMAMTHADTRSVYGKRLVYGGHTISIAAQLARAAKSRDNFGVGEV